MKKIITCLCCIATLVSFAACNDTKTESKAEKTSTTTTKSIEISQADVTFNTVKEYVESNKESFQAYKESMGGTGLGLDIYARDNSLVYSYRYSFDIDDIESVKETLEQGFEATKDTYQLTFKAVKSEVPTVESVILEYLDKDGTLITSYEIKEDEE